MIRHRYVDPEARELCARLKEKFGSTRAIAMALSIPRRTYCDWLTRGLTSPEKWNRVKVLLRTGLNDEPPTGMSHGT